MAKVNWKKILLEEGTGGLGPSTRLTLARIQDIYVRDYLRIARRMAQEFGPEMEEGILASELHADVQYIIRLLGKARNNETPITALPKIVTELDATEIRIENALQKLNQATKKDKYLSEQLKDIESKTGKNFEGLTDLHKGISKKMGSLYEKRGLGTFETIKKVAPGAVETLGDIGTGLLGATFGPFAGMVKGAGETVVNIAKHIREQKIKADQRKMAAKFSRSTGRTTDLFREDFISERQRGPRLSEIAQPGASFSTVEGVDADSFEGRMHQYEKEEARYYRRKEKREGVTPSTKASFGSTFGRTVSEYGGTAGAIGGSSLFGFFHKDAYNARWTKEVVTHLQILSKGQGSAGSGGLAGWLLGGGLGALLTRFGSLIGLLAPIAMGIAGLVASIATVKNSLSKVGEWFGRKPGEKVPLGEKVAAGVGGFLGGTGKGIGEQGTTWGGVAANAGANALRLGMLGAGIGRFFGPVGALIGGGIGAGVGAIGGLVGGRRMANAVKAAYQWSPASGYEGARNLGGSLMGRLFGKKDRGTTTGESEPAIADIANSTISEKRASERVVEPFTSSSVAQFVSLQQEISKLSGVISKMDQNKLNAPVLTSSKPAQDDVYNTRDPLMSGLGSGQVGVRD